MHNRLTCGATSLVEVMRLPLAYIVSLADGALQVAPGDLPYPMPWAETIESSFVETPAAYRALLQAAGFVIESEADRGDMTRELGRQMREHVARDGPPPLGLHTIMGPATPERLGNVMKTLEARIIAPIQMIARAV